MRRGFPKKIDGYTVVSRIGKGRYGVCFLAENRSGEQVILKRFRPGMLRRNRGTCHYEAVILSGLAHPAIPGFLGVVHNKQGYFFVLEYKKGRTLKEWLFAEKKVFAPEEICRIGAQIFEILEYLQGKGNAPWYEELELTAEQKREKPPALICGRFFPFLIGNCVPC